MNISAVTDLRQVTTCERLTYYKNCYVTAFLLFICSDKSMPKPNRTKGAALWNGIFFNIADYENSTLAQNYRLNSLNQVISQVVQNKLSNGDFVCPCDGWRVSNLISAGAAIPASFGREKKNPGPVCLRTHVTKRTINILAFVC